MKRADGEGVVAEELDEDGTRILHLDDGRTARVIAPHPGKNATRRAARRAGFKNAKDPQLRHDLKLAGCGHWVRRMRKVPPAAKCPTCGMIRDVERVKSRRVLR